MHMIPLLFCVCFRFPSLFLRGVVDVGVAPRLAQTLVGQDLGDGLCFWVGPDGRVAFESQMGGGTESGNPPDESRMFFTYMVFP